MILVVMPLNSDIVKYLAMDPVSSRVGIYDLGGNGMTGCQWSMEIKMVDCSQESW